MRRKLVVAGAVLALAAAAYAQAAEDAFGVWENPENKSHTQFYKCGDGVCAKIIRVVDGQKTDDKNPDPAKRNRPIEGPRDHAGRQEDRPCDLVRAALQPRRRQDLRRHAHRQEQDAVELSGWRWCSARPPPSSA